ncbi:MAG: hypothetical protein RIB97_13170 [Nitratireductor sp.]
MTFAKFGLLGWGLGWFAISLMRLFDGDQLASESALSLALLVLLLASDKAEK